MHFYLFVYLISYHECRLNFHLFHVSRFFFNQFPFAFQIGIVGESEEWLMVQELTNEPDARSLEVLDLNPYTFYRWAHWQQA